jgi:hypothetical protein
MLQYVVVSRSRFRHCFFDTNKGELIERELESFPSYGLELIQNKHYNFVVKRTISEEDKEFLRTFKQNQFE